MKVDRIGACIAALVFGFFLIAAVSECEARDPRIGELYPEPALPSGICGIPRMSPDGSYIVFPDDSHKEPLRDDLKDILCVYRWLSDVSDPRWSFCS